MNWSQLKKQLHGLMTPDLRDRVGIHFTRYRQAHDEDYGRGWITLDGEQLLDASDFRYLFAENDEATISEARAAFPGSQAWSDHSGTVTSRSVRHLLGTRGVYSRGGFFDLLYEYIHSPINQSLASPYPLVRALALLDRRVGRRTLERLVVTETEHPLIHRFYALRLSAIDRNGQPLEVST